MDAHEYYERHLKYCPECGKLLEKHAFNHDWSCFLHGDFAIVNNEVVWLYSENLIQRGDGAAC